MDSIELIDSHWHPSVPGFDIDPEQVIKDGHKVGVNKAICVGTALNDSEFVVNFAQDHQNLWSSIGIHPHESDQYVNSPSKLKKFNNLASSPKVVAVGECGLDFYYNHSSREAQLKILRFQIELALSNNLPMIFHVRNAFTDFWPIFDEYPGIQGVIHSFTSDSQDLEQIIRRGLLVGLNGIMTFTKKEEQLTAAKKVPLEKLLLETDAPFLTPAPYRGTICQLKHIRVIAEFLSNLRDESLENLAHSTTQNAKKLFSLK